MREREREREREGEREIERKRKKESKAETEKYTFYGSARLFFKKFELINIERERENKIRAENIFLLLFFEVRILFESEA